MDATDEKGERDLVWETLVDALGILRATGQTFLCRVLEAAIEAYEAGEAEELAGRLEEPAEKYELGFWG